MNSSGKTRKNSGRFRRELFYALFLLPALFSPAPAQAAINPTINYQGFLLSKATNLPVETPQAINFVIYNAPVLGTALFSETRCKIGVNKGRYDVEIGSVTPGGIPASVLLNNQNLWLEIQVDPDNNCTPPYEAMTPRMRLQASPYAFNSLYASTASAGTTVFTADIIAAHDQTTFGAITISTNLFVQGGISVGNISPGQKLSVAGLVESKGTWPDCAADPLNYTCGFRFPDGSVQVKAAAITMWEASGDNVYSINPGNLGIGEHLTSPLARLHVSSAAGDTGDLFLVSTGAIGNISPLFKVNGLGEIYGGSYFGNGATLRGVVRQGGDTMTGQLTLNGSSLTVTAPDGAGAPKLTLRTNVVISSAPAAFYGGVYISSNVYLAPGAVLYGDGGGLTDLFTYDNSKVWRTGDTMTGPLTLGYSTTTLLGSTLTVKGNAFSVDGSTFSVLNGKTAIGSTSYLARLTVGGGIIATSSITAQGGLYSPILNADQVNLNQGVRASSATFWGWDADTNYTIDTASGVLVRAGIVNAPYFVGDGSLLTHVVGTDPLRVRKAGDTMTGNLQITGSSLTVAAYGANFIYALTVASSAAPSTYYSLAVTTAGNVGVQVSDPQAPLDVRKRALISYGDDGEASLDIYASGNQGYIRWRDYSLSNSGGESQGALGYLPGQRTFAYRVMGTDPSTAGTEVFRITSDDNNVSPYWKFGIGTQNPTQRLHIAVNTLMSMPGGAPLLFVSTTTGRVAVGTLTTTHALTVNGGINAVSSITAQGGFFGDGSGLVNISTTAIPQEIKVATITAIPGSAYDAVVFTTSVYVNSKLAVGGVFSPQADLNVRGIVQVNAKPGAEAVLSLTSYDNDISASANSYIKWSDGLGSVFKGVLGVESNYKDLIYIAGGASLTDLLPGGSGTQAFRIKSDGKFIIGDAPGNAAETERFHVMTNLMVSKTGAAGALLYVSTGTGYVGISTGTPREGMHIASSLLVGGSRVAAALYVSTFTGYTGIGTGSPSALLTVGNGNILAAGTHSGVQSLPVTGPGTRLMWLPSMGAIRAGDVAGTQWDTIGDYSVAFGQNSNASAAYSAVLGGANNVVQGANSAVGGGYENVVTGESSLIPGGRWNVVRSTYAFAGGYNNYLDTNSDGTFLWAYDDTASNHGINNPDHHITAAYSFLIDPNDIKHYKVGVRTPAPQTALDVNGDAQFGSGLNKSTFTAEGFWVPRSVTTGQLPLTAPTGAVLFNASINDLCVFTGSAWYIVGTKGVTTCN